MRPPASGSPEECRWAELLDYEAGLRTPRPTRFPVVPDLSPTARLVAEKIELFVGLRDPRWDGQPFTIARRFCRALTGLTDSGARTGVEELRLRGYMFAVGKVRGGAIEYRFGPPPDGGQT